MVGQNQNFVTSSQHPCQARSTFRIPAVQAFLIQLIALPASLILVGLVSVLTDKHVGILEVALLQGGVAALIARWRRLAWWWVAIQLFFPCALIAVHSLELPSWIFLVGFFFLLSIYWTTFQTQVPFFPSNPTAWEAVLSLLPREAPVRLIDIGSGMGGGVLYMAAQQPESVFVGIEVAPLPWLVSAIKGWLTRSSARFIRGSYVDLDLGDYDVVFAYLSPVAMSALWEKVQREMRRGSLLLSYEFPIPSAPADTVIKLSEEDVVLYAWYIQ